MRPPIVQTSQSSYQPTSIISPTASADISNHSTVRKRPASSLEEESIALQLPPGSQFSIHKDTNTPKALGHTPFGQSPKRKAQPTSLSTKFSKPSISRKLPVNPTDDMASTAKANLPIGSSNVSSIFGASKLSARLRNRDGQSTSIVDYSKDSVKKQRSPVRTSNLKEASKRKFSAESSDGIALHSSFREYDRGKENVFDIPLDVDVSRCSTEDLKRKDKNVESKTIAKTNPPRGSNKKLHSLLQSNQLQTSLSTSRPLKEMNIEHDSSWRPKKVPRRALKSCPHHQPNSQRIASLAHRPMRSTRKAAIDAYEKITRNEVETNHGNKTDDDSVKNSILDAEALGLSLTQPFCDESDKDLLQQKWPQHTLPKDSHRDCSIETDQLMKSASKRKPILSPDVGKHLIGSRTTSPKKPQGFITKNGGEADNKSTQLAGNLKSQTAKSNLSNQALRGMAAKIGGALATLGPKDNAPHTIIGRSQPSIVASDALSMDQASSSHGIHHQDLPVTPLQIIEISSDMSAIISSYFSPDELAEKGKPGCLNLEYHQSVLGSSDGTMQPLRGAKALFPSELPGKGNFQVQKSRSTDPLLTFEMVPTPVQQKRKLRDDEENLSREKRTAILSSDKISGFPAAKTAKQLLPSLIDDHLVRKPQIVNWGPRGARNNGRVSPVKAFEEMGIDIQKIGSQSTKVYENGSPVSRQKSAIQTDSLIRSLQEQVVEPKVTSSKTRELPPKLPSYFSAHLLDWPNALDSPPIKNREEVLSSNSKRLPLPPTAIQPAGGLEPHRIGPGEKYTKLVTAEVVEASIPLVDPFNLVPPNPPSKFIQRLQEKYIETKEIFFERALDSQKDTSKDMEEPVISSAGKFVRTPEQESSPIKTSQEAYSSSSEDTRSSSPSSVSNSRYSEEKAQVRATTPGPLETHHASLLGTLNQIASELVSHMMSGEAAIVDNEENYLRGGSKIIDDLKSSFELELSSYQKNLQNSRKQVSNNIGKAIQNMVSNRGLASGLFSDAEKNLSAGNLVVAQCFARGSEPQREEKLLD
ncbi:MAG: hypothetical protein M1829_005385 [Trizodia sp. TS-e1964]|nr:MAG: hypothetical protein M1829_005385 [Trizodia sp. TS-e1964]